MKKQEFLHVLEKRIAALDREDVSSVLEYYSKKIDDDAIYGQSEADIIAHLGTPEELADKILKDYGASPMVEVKKEVDNYFRVLFTLGFLILNIIIGGPLLLALFGTFGGLSLGGLAAFFGGLAALVTKNIFEGMTAMGVGLILMNIGVVGIYAFTKVLKTYFVWVNTILRGEG